MGAGRSTSGWSLRGRYAADAKRMPLCTRNPLIHCVLHPAASTAHRCRLPTRSFRHSFATFLRLRSAAQPPPPPTTTTAIASRRRCDSHCPSRGPRPKTRSWWSRWQSTAVRRPQRRRAVPSWRRRLSGPGPRSVTALRRCAFAPPSPPLLTAPSKPPHPRRPPYQATESHGESHTDAPTRALNSLASAVRSSSSVASCSHHRTPPLPPRRPPTPPRPHLPPPQRVASSESLGISTPPPTSCR